MPYKYFSEYPTTPSPFVDEWNKKPDMYTVPGNRGDVLYPKRHDEVDSWLQPEKTFILYGKYERAIVTAAIDLTHMFDMLEIIRFESLDQIMNCLTELNTTDPNQIVIVVGVPNDSIIALCESGAAAGDAQDIYMVLCTSELTAGNALCNDLNEHDAVYAYSRVTAHDHCIALLCNTIRKFKKHLRSRKPDLPDPFVPTPFFKGLHRTLAKFRDSEYKYMKFMARPVKEWFAMHGLLIEIDALIIEQIMHMAFSSDRNFCRRIKSNKHLTMLKLACR